MSVIDFSTCTRQQNDLGDWYYECQTVDGHMANIPEADENKDYQALLDWQAENE